MRKNQSYRKSRKQKKVTCQRDVRKVEKMMTKIINPYQGGEEAVTATEKMILRPAKPEE